MLVVRSFLPVSWVWHFCLRAPFLKHPHLMIFTCERELGWWRPASSSETSAQFYHTARRHIARNISFVHPLRTWDVTSVFMFCWPCISIHLCNKNQLDALFILCLFRQATSTCLGHICSPSSGVILCIHNNWYVLCCSVDCLLAGLRWKHLNPANFYVDFCLFVCLLFFFCHISA